MRYVLMLLVMISGATIPIQIAANKRLSEAVKSPVVAVAMALAIGLTILTAVALTNIAGARGQLSQAPQAPWWAWLGGLLIGFAVTVQIINAKQEGAGPIIALIIAGQLTSAMLVDHFGWLGMEKDPVRWWKIVGALLMAGGAGLMQIEGK